MIAASRLGGQHRELHARLADQVQPVEVQLQVADDVVVVPLGAALVLPDVVLAPEPAEVVAPGGEFADEVV